MPVGSAVAAKNITRRWGNLVSTLIDPQPRLLPGPPISIKWPVRHRLRCPEIVFAPPAQLSTILEQRRSHRTLGVGPLREIVNVLAYTTRPRFNLENDIYLRSRRISMSAGAIHCIDILILDVRGHIRLMRYDPFAHMLEVMLINCVNHISIFQKKLKDILGYVPSTILIFVADLRKISALYDNPLSLVWRDAGALLQTLGIVATAYRLGFCPLGPLGSEIVDALGLPSRHAQSMGSAAIGRPL